MRLANLLFLPTSQHHSPLLRQSAHFAFSGRREMRATSAALEILVLLAELMRSTRMRTLPCPDEVALDVCLLIAGEESTVDARRCCATAAAGLLLLPAGPPERSVVLPPYELCTSSAMRASKSDSTSLDADVPASLASAPCLRERCEWFRSALGKLDEEAPAPSFSTYPETGVRFEMPRSCVGRVGVTGGMPLPLLASDSVLRCAASVGEVTPVRLSRLALRWLSDWRLKRRALATLDRSVSD